MSAYRDNETWVVERGHVVVQKKVAGGLDSLTLWEKLVYCLWVADYGMRNAGDLDTAHDLYADFYSEGRRIAQELSLGLTHRAFSMSQNALEQAYFEEFDAICNEIKNAEPSA
jgi:hypothetical protein